MKKLILITILLISGIWSYSQSLFKPVAPFPEQRTFNAISVAASQKWEFRIDGTIQLSEVVYNKLSKVLETNAVFGIGPAIGLQHYVPGADGTTPFNNYGFGAGVLLGEQMKFVLQANLMQYFKVGFTITPNPKTNIFPVGLFFGGGITF